MKNRWRRVTLPLLLFVSVLVGGTVGYMLIENISCLDSLYMTIITISTVGFHEVTPLSPAGKIFTLFIIISGLGTAAYGVGGITGFVIEGEFGDLMRRRLMNKKIKNLRNHFIICGFGATGAHVVNKFVENNSSFIVIDNNADKTRELEAEGYLIINGDAREEDVLQQAQIDDARGLIACLSTDADNVFVVLTARQLSQDLYIISRAISDHSQQKLIKAGANKVVSPNLIGGRRMASLALQPAIVSFLDIITQVGEKVLDLEDIPIPSDSCLVGKTLEDCRIPEKTGLIVLAVSSSGELHWNPRADYKLNPDEILIVLGEADQINKLREIVFSAA